MDIRGQKFDIQIQNLVYGGNGMGRLPDGRAVFVPFVLAGEKSTDPNYGSAPKLCPRRICWRSWSRPQHGFSRSVLILHNAAAAITSI